MCSLLQFFMDKSSPLSVVVGVVVCLHTVHVEAVKCYQENSITAGAIVRFLTAKDIKQIKVHLFLLVNSSVLYFFVCKL